MAVGSHGICMQMGASTPPFAVHTHIPRGSYHGSPASPRESVRPLGAGIPPLMIATALTGHAPPRGQTSPRGATATTSPASATPVTGDTTATRPRGGSPVENATLNRSYSPHYPPPSLPVGASIPHPATSHQHGSNNALGITPPADKTAPHPHPHAKARRTHPACTPTPIRSGGKHTPEAPTSCGGAWAGGSHPPHSGTRRGRGDAQSSIRMHLWGRLHGPMHAGGHITGTLSIVEADKIGRPGGNSRWVCRSERYHRRYARYTHTSREGYSLNRTLIPQ